MRDFFDELASHSSVGIVTAAFVSRSPIVEVPSRTFRRHRATALP